jgi:hypothetical protein
LRLHFKDLFGFADTSIKNEVFVQMINDPFMQNVNKTIGDNMRFAQNYHPGQGGTASTGGASSADLMSVLNPMLMLMLFQLMSVMMSKMQGGAPSSAYGLPQAPLPYIPGLSSSGSTVPPSTSAPSLSPAPASSIADNPAVSYLENMLVAETPNADPSTGSVQLSVDDITAVKAAVSSGTFSKAQVGQALMYELDKTPTQNLSAIGQLISSLADSGDLNVSSFLQDDYLSRLDSSGLDLLMNALTQAGLTQDDGTPNARLFSFMLDSLAKDSDGPSKAFVQQLMQAIFYQSGADPTTADGKVMEQLLSLSGTTVDAQNQLVYTKPSALLAATQTATATTPAPAATQTTTADQSLVMTQTQPTAQTVATTQAQPTVQTATATQTLASTQTTATTVDQSFITAPTTATIPDQSFTTASQTVAVMSDPSLAIASAAASSQVQPTVQTTATTTTPPQTTATTTPTQASTVDSAQATTVANSTQTTNVSQTNGDTQQPTRFQIFSGFLQSFF